MLNTASRLAVREETGVRLLSVPKDKASRIIQVNRSVCAAYPELAEPLYPGLERTGPSEYDLKELLLYRHPDQAQAYVMRGDVVHQHLREQDMIRYALGLEDANAIKEIGIDTFQQFFDSNGICFWRAAAQFPSGDTQVPCVFEDFGGLQLQWISLSSNVWSDVFHAVHFAIPTQV